MTINTIAVLGLGKVGRLAATFLAHSVCQNVIGVDTTAPDRIPGKRFTFEAIDVLDVSKILELFGRVDAVLSCLPYHFNKRIADLAHLQGIHYFDLTEDVDTTNHIRELAKTSKGVMAPQCGLAPGLVGIVGADLIKQFESVRHLKLRVGALPQNPTGLLGYSFNWSPEGVVNEYLNDCEVIENGVQKMVSPMEWLETVSINGQQLEAFTTSGGLGTMCETLRGRVDNLDYKTMRYPGHANLMNFFFHELLMRDDKETAQRILTNAKPAVDDDVVYVHISAEGKDANAKLKRTEFVRAYYPTDFEGERRTAISWTTALSVASVIALVNFGRIEQQGFIHQEYIPLDAFKTIFNTILPKHF